MLIFGNSKEDSLFVEDGLSPFDMAFRFAARKIAWMNDANKDTFHWGTEAWFRRVGELEMQDILKHGPTTVSDSGSQYWCLGHGVYRLSDHWGRKVGTCDWFLEGQSPSDSSFSFNEGEVMGYADWEDFKLKTEEVKAYDRSLPQSQQYIGDYRITFEDVNDGVAVIDGEFFNVEKDKVRDQYKLVKESSMANKVAKTPDQVWMELCDYAEEYCKQEGWNDLAVEEAAGDFFYNDRRAFFDLLYGLCDGDLDLAGFGDWLPAIISGIKDEMNGRARYDEPRFASMKGAEYWVEECDCGGYVVWGDAFSEPCAEFDDYESAREFAMECNYTEDFEGVDGVQNLIQDETGQLVASKEAYVWPQVDEFAERALDIEKNQFRNWSSLDEIREDEDVRNLAETMNLDEDTFEEGCRRVFEEAPLWTKPVAKKSFVEKVVDKVKNVFKQAEEKIADEQEIFTSDNGRTFVYDDSTATLKWVDYEYGLGTLCEFGLSREDWEENPDYWIEQMNYRIDEELGYMTGSKKGAGLFDSNGQKICVDYSTSNDAEISVVAYGDPYNNTLSYKVMINGKSWHSCNEWFEAEQVYNDLIIKSTDEVKSEHGASAKTASEVGFKIYQTDNRDYRFKRWNWAKEHDFDFDDYDEVWDGSMEAGSNEYQTLNSIYETFNINHPEGYAARSLSMSDIVELGGRLYYVDAFGFEDITDVVR